MADYIVYSSGNFPPYSYSSIFFSRFFSIQRENNIMYKYIKKVSFYANVLKGFNGVC